MKTKSSIFVLPILILWALSQIACAAPKQDEPVTTANVDGRARIQVFGDSISYCYYCFPSAVAALLPNTRLMNQAEPGTSIEQDEQIGRILRSDIQPSDRVIFLTGYNNMRGHGADPVWLDIYRTNLRLALAHFAQAGQPTYIGTPMNALCVDAPSIARNGHGCDAGVGAIYSQIIKDEIAAINAPNIHLVDVNAKWVGTYQNLTDMVHPTYAGYAQIAQFFLEVMQ